METSSDSDSDFVVRPSFHWPGRGRRVTDTDQAACEEQNYRETMHSECSYMGWSHIPDRDSNTSRAENNPFEQYGREVAGLPMHENHSSSVAQHALVLESCDHVKSDPIVSAQPAHSIFNQTPHRYLSNLHLYAWLLEPQQSRRRASLRQWQHEGNSSINVSKDDNLTCLLDSFHRDRPKGRRGIPCWNLSLVLHHLTKAPFEPIKEASLKHLTFKTIFLLALGSGKRRSEIHSWQNKHIRHQSDWTKEHSAFFPRTIWPRRV